MKWINSISCFAKKYICRGAMPYLWLAFGSAFLSLVSEYALYKNVINTRMVQILCMAAIIIIAATAVWLKVIKRLSVNKLVFLAVAGGFIIRAAYVAYSAVTVRQHDADVYYTYDVLSNGHFGYMMTIYNTGKLPLTNEYQFYHPPLMYYLGALLIWFFTDVVNVQVRIVCELIQMLPLFFSSATMLVMIKIIRRMKLSDTVGFIAVVLTVFQPHGIIMAGSINNDAPAWLFFCMVVLYLMKWYEKPTMGNIIVTALSLGLGMMTKMSVALLIPIIAVVFIYKFVREFKTSAADYYPQFAAFLCISAPIAMWFPVRNYILFGQSLNYVTRLPTDNVRYTGIYSVFERFALDLSEIFKSPFWQVTDKNVWSLLAKTASFDEASYSLFSLPAMAVVIINLLFIIATVAALVFVLTKERKFDYCLLACVWGILIASFIKFSIDYPYVCTSNYRYIFPTAMIGAIFMARSCELMEKRKKWATAIYAVISLIFIVNVCVSFTSKFMLEG